MTKTPETTKTAIAHGNYVRGSASKVRRVLDQIRGRSYRDALIMLEFMPYRSTDPITKVLRSAVANAEHNQCISIRSTPYLIQNSSHFRG